MRLLRITMNFLKVTFLLPFTLSFYPSECMRLNLHTDLHFGIFYEFIRVRLPSHPLAISCSYISLSVFSVYSSRYRTICIFCINLSMFVWCPFIFHSIPHSTCLHSSLSSSSTKSTSQSLSKAKVVCIWYTYAWLRCSSPSHGPLISLW